jgi:hypothetical protein
VNVNPLDFRRTGLHAEPLPLDTCIADRTCAVVIDPDLTHGQIWQRSR